jgi:hypothetical protein
MLYKMQGYQELWLVLSVLLNTHVYRLTSTHCCYVAAQAYIWWLVYDCMSTALRNIEKAQC